MSANNLSGPLPPEWGANGSTFERLQSLSLQENGIEGYLPDAWGAGFQVGTSVYRMMPSLPSKGCKCLMQELRGCPARQ